MAGFRGVDFIDFDSQLNDEEKLVRRTAREFVDNEIIPIIEKHNREGTFPRHVVPQLGELGFFGASLHGYGCAGMSHVAYGLVMQELERGDSGLRSFVSVQSALVMYPIHAYGSDEQKNKWLPLLQQGKAIGCFGLTEPQFGSNPAGMLTRAVKKGNRYVLNGEKMWITNGSIADVAVVWAKREDDQVCGCLVEKGTAGYQTWDVHGKWSLRASVTSGLAFSDCEIPEQNLLPNAVGLRAPLSCLNQARYGIGWGALGAAMACYDTALQYAKTRKQFADKPIASHQLVQEKLVWMITARPGDWFELRGEMLTLPPGQGFSIYSLAALLPLLPAKQRATDAADWMSSDAEVACPDPNCPSRFRITRLGKRRFEHGATTAVPMATEPATAEPMIPRFTLPHAHEISRLIKGGWHLSGDHGPIEPEQAVHDMAAFVEAGITTFDCADIYTNAEQLIGDFRRRYPTLARQVRVHTKYVPNLSDLATLTPQQVATTVERSLARLGVERLDLVQFHWWDFAVPGHVEAALALARLREQGKIANVAVTNYDSLHLRELLDAGVPVVAHQLQYSLLDERPSARMLPLCRDAGVAFLCYGTVAGGFLSDRWLGQPEPATLSNRSLIKYKLVIDDFGGWPLLQRLLSCLRGIADRHGSDIATVATRVVLERENVAAAIVGAINTSHLAAHRQIGALQLDASDHAAIAAVLADAKPLEGDVYELERDRHGRHGRIMKYELQ